MVENETLAKIVEKIFGNDGCLSTITPPLLIGGIAIATVWHFVKKAVGEPNSYSSVNPALLTPFPTPTMSPTFTPPEFLGQGNIDSCMLAAQATQGIYGPEITLQNVIDLGYEPFYSRAIDLHTLFRNADSSLFKSHDGGHISPYFYPNFSGFIPENGTYFQESTTILRSLQSTNPEIASGDVAIKYILGQPNLKDWFCRPVGYGGIDSNTTMSHPGSTDYVTDIWSIMDLGRSIIHSVGTYLHSVADINGNGAIDFSDAARWATSAFSLICITAAAFNLAEMAYYSEFKPRITQYITSLAEKKTLILNLSFV